MHYVKYMPFHSMREASRNRREICAALEYGYTVSVFSMDTSREGTLLPEHVEIAHDGEIYFDYSTPKWKRIFLLLRNYIVLIIRTAKLNADVLSCHDLSALHMAYLATWWKRKRPKLIYDSHEFELGRIGSRTKLQHIYVKHLERFLIRRCAFSIMVNDSIADEVQKIHKLKQRPIVVRSTPEKWTVDPEETKKKRRELLDRFTDSRVEHIMMFHGNLGNGNGLEMTVPTLQKFKDIGIVLMGAQVSKELIRKIQEKSKEAGVEGRLLIIPPVNITELWKYSGAADVEMMAIEPVSKSYYYSLPNKLFESIQSETPVIASDLPEMKRIVEGYRIGLLCSPGDVRAFCDCVDRMLPDRELYSACKQNMLKAKEDLCWEKEKQVLKDAFHIYIGL